LVKEEPPRAVIAEPEPLTTIANEEPSLVEERTEEKEKHELEKVPSEEIVVAQPVVAFVPRASAAKRELRFAEDIPGAATFRGEAKTKKKKKGTPGKEREEEGSRVRKGRRQDIQIEDEDEY
jgi:hypothetical protein